MHAAECSFPEIPGWVLLPLLPTEVGYMAEGVSPYPWMAAREDRCALPGLRACAWRQMCPLCRINLLVWSVLHTLALCPVYIWTKLLLQSPFNHFLFITVMHSHSKQIQTLTDSFTHTHTHTHRPTQPSIHPMLSKQINSWSQKPFALLANRSQGTPSNLLSSPFALFFLFFSSWPGVCRARVRFNKTMQMPLLPGLTGFSNWAVVSSSSKAGGKTVLHPRAPSSYCSCPWRTKWLHFLPNAAGLYPLYFF